MANDKKTSPACTAGDWFPAFHESTARWSVHAQHGAFEHELAQVHGGGREAMANAFLMGASKRLLEACGLALKDLEDLDAPEGCPSLRPLRDAIAAAGARSGLRNAICRCPSPRPQATFMPDTLCPCGVGVGHWHCATCRGVFQIGE